MSGSKNSVHRWFGVVVSSCIVIALAALVPGICRQKTTGRSFAVRAATANRRQPDCRSPGARRKTSAGKRRSTAKAGRRRSFGVRRFGSPPRLKTASKGPWSASIWQSGKIKHDKLILELENPQYSHPTNSYASPTPFLEGRSHLSPLRQPEEDVLPSTPRRPRSLWSRLDFPCNHYRGAGSSPILFENLLFVAFRRLQRAISRGPRQDNRQNGLEARDRNIKYKSDNGDIKEGLRHLHNHRSRWQAATHLPQQRPNATITPTSHIAASEIWLPIMAA